MNIRFLLIAAALLCPAAVASAQPSRTSLDVEYGWGQWVRPGRWTPVTIVVSDPKVRGAILEVYAPQAGSNAMRVRQGFALGPTPTVFPLYVPLIPGGGETLSVLISDAETGKTLARYPLDPDTYSGRNNFMEATRRLVGVSGQYTSWQLLQGQDGVARLATGHLKPELLPAAPVGYDSLDLLILHSPNLLQIDVAQQKAILDWVRGGGNLLLWPGDDPIPERGPLVENLPCTVGGPIEIPLGDAAKNLGSGRRITGVRGRALTPAAGAEAITLLGSPESTAYARRLGLGRVVVAPTDLSQLRFDSSDKDAQLWRPLLAGMGLLNEEQPTGQNNRSYWGVDPDVQRESVAVSNLQNQLADVPGAGRFGFSYVATVLLGMMVIVGPVDWFVLKRLGRQPWTWATTAGWIGLVTLGALYAGHFFKSGDLHYRSVTLIDQAGDATVGRGSLTCIYSPRTTDYHLDAPATGAATEAPDGGAGAGPDPFREPPDGWWEPSSAQANYYYGSHGLKTDVPFRQTQGGNAPGALLINVWNMRFLRSRSIEAGSPMMRASLSIAYRPDGPPTVGGTIANLSDRPLVSPGIELAEGVYVPGNGKGAALRIEPGTTVAVDGSWGFDRAVEEAIKNADFAGDHGRYNRHDRRGALDEMWIAARDLSGTRSRRIRDLVRFGGHAAVVAELADASPPAVLREPGAKERHFTLVRAVVPLAGARPATRPAQTPPSNGAEVGAPPVNGAGDGEAEPPG